MDTTIIPLMKEDPVPFMVTGQIAIKTGEKPELLFKDIKGVVHSLTSDKTRIEVIKKLIYDNVRIIRH
jgi:hypothetical protein